MTRTKAPPCVITIPFEGKQKRICKILPLGDGGFSLTPPSNSSRSGALFKSPHISKIGEFYLDLDTIVLFSASDRVKLSYHADGFSQFSGAGSSPIVSGRDSNGAPRGIGVMTSPLKTPIYTGPSVSIGVWGLQEFVNWSTRPAEMNVHLEDADYYLDRINPEYDNEGVHGHEISFMAFPTEHIDAIVENYSTGQRVILQPPRWLTAPSRQLPARLIRVSSLVTLAVIAKEQRFSFGSESGYRLAGPSDSKHYIHAIYPFSASRSTMRSLDFVSEPSEN